MQVLYIATNWNQSWCDSKNTIQFFLCPRPINSNASPLTFICINTSLDMCWRTDAVSPINSSMTENGENDKWSNMSPSDVTLPLDTSQPSQWLICIIKQSHYTNQHNHTSNSFLMCIYKLLLYKTIIIIIVINVFYNNLF